MMYVLPDYLCYCIIIANYLISKKVKFRFVEYILSIINGDMGVPFQVRSRYFSRLAVLKLS